MEWKVAWMESEGEVPRMEARLRSKQRWKEERLLIADDEGERGGRRRGKGGDKLKGRGGRSSVGGGSIEGFAGVEGEGGKEGVCRGVQSGRGGM